VASDFSVADCKVFEYRPTPQESIKLMGALEHWADDHDEIMAEHHLLKRDGELQEPMGSHSSKFTFSCIFYGGSLPEFDGDVRSSYARYADAVAFFRRHKRGTLMHPQLGEVPVAYRGMRQQSTPLREGDAVIFELRFAEDQIDGTLAAEPAPSALAASATNGATAMQTAARAKAATVVLRAKFATALAIAAQVYDLTYSLTSTALAAYNAVKSDPSLLGALGAVIGASQACVAEFKLQGVVGVDLYPITSASRATIAGSVNLYHAVKASGPGTETVVVQAAQTLQALCAARYGAQLARAKVQETLVLNPSLRMPEGMIPAGEVLTMPSAAAS